MYLLSNEVSHLQGTSTRHWPKPVVVQLAVPEGAIRQDGQLAKGRQAPEHPGVILTVETPTGPLRFSCDRFDQRWKGASQVWQHNLRAIALGLEALRKVERYGMGSGTEQYAGFQALPPATPMGAAMTREDAARLLLREAGLLVGEVQVAEVLADGEKAGRIFRLAAKGAHHDQGGDPEVFRRLTAARDLLAS